MSSRWHETYCVFGNIFWLSAESGFEIKAAFGQFQGVPYFSMYRSFESFGFYVDISQITETYSEFRQTSKVECSTEIVSALSCQLLTKNAPP